jgi:predicted phage terminase large subunit-like protein
MVATSSGLGARQRLVEMSAGEFADLVEETDPSDVFALLRARWSDPRHLDEFARFCFPDRFDLPFSDLHRALFTLHEVQSWDKRVEDVRHAVAAPRGFAKSTIVSFLRLAHDIVYDREAYVALLSSGQRLSLSLSRDLRAQFIAKDTPFARLYGPFRVTGGTGEWEVSVRGRPTVGVLARSFGTEVRGAKHPTRGIRVTKVVVDDGEKKDRVRNPEQRAIWEDVLNKDILKLGRRQGGLVVEVVGTVLHQDSMLARRLKDPGWKSQRWKAIISWPTRMDLWERCRGIWADLTLGKQRRACALAFYRANRAEMDEGAVILDPAAKSLFQLFELIWVEGMSSFLSELQNEPRDSSTAIFSSERFARFRLVGDGTIEVLDSTKRRVRLADMRLFGRWDPATGVLHGDYASIAVVGRDPYNYGYVLASWMARVPPSAQLAAAWSIAERFDLRRMTVESNGFQTLAAEPYRRERDERRESGQFWQLQLQEAPSTDNKEARIATMEPDITNGWLLFEAGIPQEVLQQFDDFPTGEHDDGPDAIHAAWLGSGGTPVKMETRRNAA